MASQFKHLEKGSAEAFAHTTRFIADVLRRGEAMTMKEIWEAGVSRGWVPAGNNGGQEGTINVGELEYPVSISKTDLKERILPSLRAQGILHRGHVSSSSSSIRLDPLTRGLRLSAFSLPKGSAKDIMSASQGSREGQHGSGEDGAGTAPTSTASASASSSSSKKTSTGSSAPTKISEWVWSLPPYLQTPPRAIPKSTRDPKFGTTVFPEVLQRHFPALIAKPNPSDPSAPAPITISDIASYQFAVTTSETERVAAKDLRTRRGRVGIRLLEEEMDGLGLNKRRRRARVGKEKKVEGEVVGFNRLVREMRRTGGLAA